MKSANNVYTGTYYKKVVESVTRTAQKVLWDSLNGLQIMYVVCVIKGRNINTKVDILSLALNQKSPNTRMAYLATPKGHHIKGLLESRCACRYAYTVFSTKKGPMKQTGLPKKLAINFPKTIKKMTTCNWLKQAKSTKKICCA